MKKENAGSPKLSGKAPGSADIFDFLYVDRARISSLYAQLFPEGTLTSVKRTTQSSFSDDKSLGTDVKILKADTKSSESGLEGIEHLFDASWSIPLEVIAELNHRLLIKSSAMGAGLGSIIQESGFLRLIDLGSMDNFWEPAIRAGIEAKNEDVANLPPGLVQAGIDAIKSMPRAIHAHFLTPSGLLWSSLAASGLASADFASTVN